MKLYITEHKIDKRKPSPTILASSWGEAEVKCPNDFTVIGELIDIIDY